MQNHAANSFNPAQTLVRNGAPISSYILIFAFHCSWLSSRSHRRLEMTVSGARASLERARYATEGIDLGDRPWSRTASWRCDRWGSGARVKSKRASAKMAEFWGAFEARGLCWFDLQCRRV